jgi:hypothetical protein
MNVLTSQRLLFRGLQNLEAAHELLIHRHHSPGIVKLPAVVGRGEDGDELPLPEELVPILHNLMGAHDEVKVELLQKVRNHIRPVRVAHTPIVLTPPLNVPILHFKRSNLNSVVLVLIQ